jgi:hypothetical protein
VRLVLATLCGPKICADKILLWVKGTQDKAIRSASQQSHLSKRQLKAGTDMYLKTFKQKGEADGEATSLSRAFIGVEELAADGALRLRFQEEAAGARQIHITHGGVFTHSGERKPNDANYIWV